MLSTKLPRLFRCLVVGTSIVTLGTGLLWCDRLRAQSAVTFDRVLDYVQLGVDEAKIAQIVKASPTKFVLGTDQVEKLRQAGASPTMIEAIQQKGTTVEAISDVSDFIIILDCSGSMNEKLSDGTSKWHAARQAAIELVQAIPDGKNLSLIAYGLDAQRECSSVDVVRPLKRLTSNDKRQITKTIEGFRAVGHTPIARSLHVASDQLTSASGMASVVLITDGMETCHADPVMEAADLVARFPSLHATVQVVGFCMGEIDAAQVSRIAKAGNGEFYDAKNAEGLIACMRKVESQLVVPIEDEQVNLEALSPIERLLVAQLDHQDMTVREAAVKTIHENKLVPAVPALIKMMIHAPWGSGLSGDDDRNAAIKAVMELAPEKAATAIRGSLRSDKWKIRYWAASAMVNHRITDAVPAAEERLLGMQESDVSTTMIQGTDEAEKLFQAVHTMAPERLESLIAKLVQGAPRSVRAWAISKVSKIKQL